MGSKTFIRITNRDIFNKLTSIESHVNKINGKVRWHTWAIGFIVIIIAVILKSII